jgi:hypothetical protein
MSRFASFRACLAVFLPAVLIAAAVMTGSSPAQPPQGKKYALLVGVRAYNHRNLDDLKYTENDVEDLGKLLREGGFAEVVVLTSTRGEKMAVQAPTAANIRKRLRAMLERVTKHDTIVVALAGHGLQLKVKVRGRETEEGFFCPADARPRDDATLEEQSKTLIGFKELFAQLDESGVGVKLLLVDACRNDPTMGRSVHADTMPRPTRGTAALFSCKSGERAFETPKRGGGHGVFFYHVIEGLKGDARNKRGEITWSSLADYVVDKVSDDVPVLIGGGARQTPEEMKKLEGKSPVLIASVRAVPHDPTFFDGKTLKDWEGDRRWWKVENGAIVGRLSTDRKMGNTFLYSKKKYRDFELHFEVRMRGKGNPGNSGVQIRSTVKDARLYSVIGPQCEIAGLTGKHIFGCLVTEPTGDPMLPAPAEVVQKVVKLHDFNDYYIRCVGKHITIRVNGHTTVDSDFKPMPAEGVIAWQLHGWFPGMEVVFKHIRFRELSRAGR